MRVARVIVAAAGVAALAGGARAQLVCGSPGKDAAIADISSVAAFAPNVFGFGFTLVNVGSAAIEVDPSRAAHPGEAANVYRLTPEGVLTHVGMSWVRHEFFALENGGVCGCAPVGGGDLGPGCQSPTSATSEAMQAQMSPRSQADPVTGFIGMPAGGSGFGVGDRRVTIAPADLDQASQYLVEVIALTPGETERMNNASWRAYAYNGTTFAPTAAAVRGQPAINALAGLGYSLAFIDAPNDGRLVVASRARELGGGMWRYDYSVFNFHSGRGAGSFGVSIPEGSTPVNVRFRDVAYFGEAYDGTDWPASVGSLDVVWSTDSFASNPDANALRWGTAYSFGFDIARSPRTGRATVGMFKPGGAGEPASFGVPVVAPRAVCPGELTGDEIVSAADLAALLGSWGANGGAADLTGDGVVNAADLAALLGGWGPC
jgi:hypothetical protein